MRRLTVIFFLLATRLIAQTDTLPVSQAIEARFGASSDLPTLLVDANDLVNLSDHPALNADYSAYKQQGNFAWYSSQLFFNFNYYRQFSELERLSWLVGGYFRKIDLATASYGRDLLFPVDVLRGDSLGHELIQYYSYNETH